jgi:hypothetical protein
MIPREYDMDNKRTTLCSGENCPIRETCAFYCPTMDKRKTDHWGVVPYNHQKGKCNFFLKKDDDSFNELNKISCNEL